MQETKLSINEYAEMMKANKPHLIKLEEEAEQLQNGEMDVTFVVRAGVVNKMKFHNTKVWLSPKTNKT